MNPKKYCKYMNPINNSSSIIQYLKNLNASRLSEHLPRRGIMLKRLRRILGCKDKKLFMVFHRVPLDSAKAEGAARSLTSQGRAEPLCARIESANREVSEGKADL